MPGPRPKLPFSTVKPRTCKAPGCRNKFVPERQAQTVCGLGCAMALARAKAEKGARIAARAERAADKERKEAIKPRSKWLREAQAAFNKFIRARDQAAGHRCISSGRELEWAGNSTDAGHYRSTGSAPHLRFDERNCHAQSKMDNRYLAGNAADYRIGLISRIGREAVEALEADQEPRKWSIDDLKEIIATYKQKAKEIIRAAQ